MSMRTIQPATVSAFSVPMDAEPDSVSVALGSADCAVTAGLQAGAPGSAAASPANCEVPIAAHLRSVGVASNTQAALLPLHGSFYEAASPMGARIAAVRVLLGADAAGHEAAKLLDLANVVHADAVDFPFDDARRELSVALWDEESRQWAQANGEGDAAPEHRLNAYRQIWDWALNPPQSLRFKGRTELTREHRAAPQGADGVRAGEKPAAPADAPAVLADYYSQFSTYIESHLDRFSSLSAVLKADAAGLGRLYIEQVPRQVWAIHGITFPSYPNTAGRSPNEWRSCSSFVVQLPDMSFGFVSETGSFKRLPQPVLTPRGALRNSAVLDAYGMRQLPASATITSDEISARGASLKDMMAAQTREQSLSAIASWADADHDASVLERLLHVLVPSYDAGQRLRQDWGRGSTRPDNALDVLELNLALASMGLAAAVGVEGMRATLASARAAGAGGPRAVAAAALAHGVMQFNTRAFLQAAVRELVDAVVPSFAANDVVRMSGSRTSWRVRENLTTLLRAPKATIDNVRAPARLDGIYRALSRTQAVDSGTSAFDIQNTIDSAAAEPIPNTLFRGPALINAKIALPAPRVPRIRASADDYLAQCLKQAARTSSTAAVPVSLTTERSAAWRFSAGRPDAVIVSIDASRERGNFRTVGNIIKYDGPRLVEERKITADALLRAVKNAFVLGGNRFFT
jgi:hypothetical protein